VKRFLLPLGAFALLVVVLLVGLRHAPEKEAKFVKSPLLGKPAPEFTLPELVDPAKSFDSARLRGGWHLVNIWATWCVTCREEHEVLLQIQREGRIPIVGLNWKDEEASAIAWLSQLGNPYETVIADRDGHVAIDFGVYLAPESFLIDPQGIVVEKQYGAMTMDDWHSKFLSHLQAPAKAGA
jgi:cytochrome c biogenesis protein CcmG, thiol:disulfide interchange protein DsbE